MLFAWKEKLSADVGISADQYRLVDIEETESLKKRFFNRVQQSFDKKLFLPIDAFDKFYSELDNLGEVLPELPVLLFHPSDEVIGALSIELSIVLNNMDKLWAFLGGDFSLATLDISSGLCIEKNYYDSAGAYVPDGILEVTAWGSFTLLMSCR